MVSELQEDFEPEELGSSSKKVSYKVEFKAPAPMRIGRSDESSEIEGDKTAPEDYDMKQTNDEFDSTINSEISELTSDAYDGWIGADTKWRRSPEGKSSLYYLIEESGKNLYLRRTQQNIDV